jgi:hypothetical protein
LTTNGRSPRNAKTTSRGRIYSWNGKSFWSVTTILKALPKEALIGWAARSVAEYAVANRHRLDAMLQAVRIQQNGDSYTITADPNAVTAAIDWLRGAPWRERERKKDLGSAVHARIEAVIKGQPLPEVPAELAPYMSHFDRFVVDFKPRFLMSEASVYNPTESYAGTLDFIAEYDIEGTVLTLLTDVKTGKDVYSEAAQQMAAYQRATFVGLPDGTEAPMPKTDGAFVLHVTEDDYEVRPVLTSDEVYRSFLFVREVFRWLEGTSKEAIGSAIPGLAGLAWAYPAKETVAA